MTNTTDAVLIPQNEWIDLYEVTGIERGAVLIVHNIGTADVDLATARTRPDYNTVAKQRFVPNDYAISDGGAYAEWAYCPNEQGLLHVRVQ